MWFYDPPGASLGIASDFLEGKKVLLILTCLREERPLSKDVSASLVCPLRTCTPVTQLPWLGGFNVLTGEE